MNYGRFQHRITFLRKGEGVDDYGNVQTGPLVEIGTVWGEMMQTRGREALDAGRVGETATAVLSVRSSTMVRGITPECSVRFEGVLWNIRSGPIPVLKDPGIMEFALERGVAI